MQLSTSRQIHGSLEKARDQVARAVDSVVLSNLKRVYQSTGLSEMDHVLRTRLEHAVYFYTHWRFLQHPSLFFTPPGPHRLSSRLLRPLKGGDLVQTTFESQFVPRYPRYRLPYLRYRENRIVTLHHYRHHSPRPTLVYIHGWLAGSLETEERLFPYRAVYDAGYDVVMFSLPFHAYRKPLQVPVGGQLFPSPHMARTNEAFAQSIFDLRVTIRHIREQGRGPVGVFGVSLGGYVSTLLSGLEEGLSFLALMVPLASLAENFWDHGDGTEVVARAAALGLNREVFVQVNQVHSPLRLPPRLPPERVLILAGRSDALCPETQVEALRRHFRAPNIRYFSGGHLLCFERKALESTLSTFCSRWFEHDEDDAERA